MEDKIGAIKGLYGATRKQTRVDVDEPITITTAHHPARIIDLSQIGMFIETPLKLEKGCEVEIYIGGMLFCAVVKRSGVKTIEKQGEKVKIAGLGVNFKILTAKHRDLIQKFIETKHEGPTVPGFDSNVIALIDPDNNARFMYSNILERHGIKVFASEDFSETLLNSIKKSGALAIICEYSSKTLRELENIRIQDKKIPIFVLTSHHDVNKLKLEDLRAKYRSKLTTTPNALLEELRKVVPNLR
jgi:hypothetical protein